MSPAIERVGDALLKRLGRPKDIAEAIEGDDIDREIAAKNICRNDQSFVPLQEAVEATGLSWQEAIPMAIEDLRVRRPAPLFAR